MSRALSYYCDMTLSQEFKPMGAQLSLKAALPLVGILATASDRCSKTGPGAGTQYDAITTSLILRQNDVVLT